MKRLPCLVVIVSALVVLGFSGSCRRDSAKANSPQAASSTEADLDLQKKQKAILRDRFSLYPQLNELIDRSRVVSLPPTDPRGGESEVVICVPGRGMRMGSVAGLEDFNFGEFELLAARIYRSHGVNPDYLDGAEFWAGKLDGQDYSVVVIYAPARRSNESYLVIYRVRYER